MLYKISRGPGFSYLSCPPKEAFQKNDNNWYININSDQKLNKLWEQNFYLEKVDKQ
jgi:hypothetical protein